MGIVWFIDELHNTNINIRLFCYFPTQLVPVGGGKLYYN